MLDPADVLTVEELAARLKVQKTWVYEKLRLGRHKPNPLPAMKIGKYLRFSWPAVAAWLESTSNTAQSLKRRAR